MPLPIDWRLKHSVEGWTLWLGMTGYLSDEWQKHPEGGVGDTGIHIDMVWTRDVDGVPVSPDRPDAIRHN